MVKILKEKNNLKNKKGITLIALVITIIVLLILAGVSIMTLAGDNGLLNRTTSAKEKTEQAGVMENIKLAYQNALIGRYANNEDNQAIARQIESDLKGIYGQDSGVTVTEENGVYTVTTPDGRYTIDASGSVSRLEGLTISQTSLNLQKREGETPTATAITATKYGIEGTVSWSISPAGVATISPETGDEIYVTPAAGGSATLTATCGGKTATVKVTVTVTVTQTFAVNFYASSTATEATQVKVVDGGNALTATNYATAKSAADSAAPSGQVFDKWVLKTAVGANAVGTDATSLLGGVTQALNVYATFKAPSFSDTYPVNTTYASQFGRIVTGYDGYARYADTDVWRLFYADTNYAYLISDRRGDWNLFYIDGFSSIKSVSDFAKNFNPQYHNWTLQTNSSLNKNLKGVEAIMTPSNWTNYKNGYANWAVGAPTLEMFVASYNATHTTAMHNIDSDVIAQQIACKVENTSSTGYKVGILNMSGTTDNTSYGNTVFDLGNSSNLDKAIYCPSSGYWWLASPSAYSSDNVMIVSHGGSGSLSSIIYNGGGVGMRPLVSVPISKIGNGITITSNY